ncbi:MAG TPA: helicase-related protein [Ignavibacteria bacterium]|nr:helicase-related protein [Ignavibacteria bacterium]
MTIEWKQKCKDCNKEFGYSDISLQKDFKKGLSRTERCSDCRKLHALEIKSIVSSHFALKKRDLKSSILGYPFIGQIQHDKKELRKIERTPNSSGMDFGIKEFHIKQVYEALEQNQVLVIIAPTGTGKSTYLPSKFIFPLEGYPIDHFTKRGPIIVTQPRIAAARKIPETIGTKLIGSSIGEGYEIGFRHGDRNNKKRGDNFDLKRNRLIYVTDGSLINWLEKGQISDFSMIIIDEAHERSCNIDLILGLVKRELLKYPELKFIIVSATIDAESFVKYFSYPFSVKFLDFSNCQKSFGYEEFPWKTSEIKPEEFDATLIEKYKQEAHLIIRKYERNISYLMSQKVIELINNTKDGGIIGFLDGQEHIEYTVKLIKDKLKDRKDVKVFPLYTGLGNDKVQEALRDIKERRIVIATNIAETSLTIPDVVYVIDSGLIKQSNWNSITCRQELNTIFHSKDGSKQRWGRAGRVQKGFVHKLYSKEQYIKYFPNHTPPEIKRSNAESIILNLFANGVNNIEEFSLLEKPGELEFQRALKVIKKRKIIDNEHDFTLEGKEIYRLSKALNSILDKVEFNSTQRALDVASFLILADKYCCLIEAITAICMMPRMGNALYWKSDGLLQWNKKLNLISKDYQIRLIDSFKAGCSDDLDFACKLYSLYEGSFFDYNLNKSYIEWFLKEVPLNYENFKLLDNTRNELIKVFSKGKKINKIRKINLNLISRVRVLASIAWPDRVVTITKSNRILFENKEYEFRGIISENCAGNWTDEKMAIVGILDQNQNDIFIEGEKIKVPIANFLIRYIKPSSSTKTIINIINTFRKYNSNSSVTDSYSNCISDLIIPINSRIRINDKRKFQKIIGYFPVAENSNDPYVLDDLFGAIYHSDKKIELEEEYKAELNEGINFKENIIIERWIKKKDKVVAVLDEFLNYEPGLFIHLKLGEKVEALIKRPIFNIRTNGLREIAGFMVSIEGFNYSLPIDQISIELQNDSLIELVNKRITLIKIGITQISKQPIFSLVPILENERTRLLSVVEIKVIVSKITEQYISFNVKSDEREFHLPLILPIAHIKDDIKFIVIGGEVTLNLKLRNQNTEKIIVDCLDDDSLTYEEIKHIENLLCKIKDNNAEYALFLDNDIQINGTEFFASKPILFQHLINLLNKYPILNSSLRILYAKSWELKISILGIDKAYDELIINISNLRMQIIRLPNLQAREILKGFKWHSYKINREQQKIIRDEMDNIWEIIRNKEYQVKKIFGLIENKSKYLDKLYTEYDQIPDFQTRKRDTKYTKIMEISNEIEVLKSQLKMYY